MSTPTFVAYKPGWLEKLQLIITIALLMLLSYLALQGSAPVQDTQERLTRIEKALCLDLADENKDLKPLLCDD